MVNRYTNVLLKIGLHVCQQCISPLDISNPLISNLCSKLFISFDKQLRLIRRMHLTMNNLYDIMQKLKTASMILFTYYVQNLTRLLKKTFRGITSI